jgi:hypothetical protein
MRIDAAKQLLIVSKRIGVFLGWVQFELLCLIAVVLLEKDLEKLVVVRLLVQAETFQLKLQTNQVLLIKDVRHVVVQNMHKVGGFDKASVSRVELLELGK